MKKLRIGTLLLLWTFISCIILASMAVSTYLTNAAIQNERLISDKCIRSLELASDLQKGSDTLTYSVWRFVATGDPAYAEEYLFEWNTTKSRDTALAELQNAGLTESDLAFAQQAKQYSDALLKEELYAMRLVYEGLHVPNMPEQIASTPLREEDQVLDDAQKVEKARKFTFGPSYESMKQDVIGSIDSFDAALETVVQENVSTAVASMERANTTQIICQILLFVWWLVLLVMVYWCLVRPIQRYSDDIEEYMSTKEDRGFAPMGAYETRHLAYAYNQFITEQKKLSDAKSEAIAAKKASKAKSDILANMSHDMRTPMNAIIGFSSLGMQAETLGESVDCHEKVQASGRYLLGMINDVLDASRLESGKAELHCEPYTYEQLEKSLRIILQARAEEKGVTLSFCHASSPRQMALFDKQRLQQIFVNLLANAIKFTPAGGVVEMTSEYQGESNGVLHERFVVRDTGIGMSPDYLENRLFREFEQEHAGEAGFEEGTGLGLSIVKRLVDMMGGTIQCESVLGEGTTFTVELSAVIVDDQACSVDDGDPEASVVLEGTKILLMEDHPLNAEIARRLLGEVGVDVVHVENGRKGLEAFCASEQGEFDAILMDIRMPEMDGLAAARAIRGLERDDARRIPLIAMTANAQEEDVRNSEEAGMNAHLSKPIESHELYATLGRCLSAGQDGA